MGTAVRHPETPAAAADAPRRAPGLELLGRYEDSGFKEPPYLARRGDGQVVQLSHLLYVVLEAIDGERDHAAVAEAASERMGRRLSADDAAFLISRKLRPQGLLAGADGRAPALEKREAALALRRRRPFVSAERVQPLARILQPLLHLPVMVLVLAALAAVDAWLFFDHGVGGPLRSALYEPVLLLAVFAAMIAGTAFHELGHAAACRFSGARPGAIGAGVYLVFPAFYCDVTDAYRLPRRGRLRTDLGGVYFNAIFALLFAGAYFATGAEVLLLVVVAQHFTVAQQLLPLLRFDGYYVLTDLTGVPDILSRVRPILRSLVPGRAPEPSVDALKPWVRRVTALYLALVVPLVAGLVVWVVLGAPRLFATIFDSLVRHGERAAAAGRDGEWASALVAVLEMGALALPLVAMTLTLWRLGQLAVALVRRWTRGSRRRQAIALAGVAVASTFLAASWWPDGDYTPLRPGERLTVTQVYSSPLQATPRGVASAPAGPGASSAATGSPARPAAPERERERPAGQLPQSSGGAREPDERRQPAPAGEPGTASAAGATASPEPAGTTQASTEPAATATPIPQPGAGDPVNEARAVNTVDGSRLFELAFSIQRVRGGEPLAHANVAQALASCTACRTIAIAVQVVIVMGGSELAAPINVAESLNSVCTACQTLALAWQLIVTTPGEVELTQEALRRIQEIERELAALEGSDAPIEEIRAAADALLRDLRETVLDGLTSPVGGSGSGQETEESTAATDERQPRATPTATVEPEPTPEAQQEATPEPTASPEETEDAEPTPEATPEPTPEQTAEPAPTAEAP